MGKRKRPAPLSLEQLYAYVPDVDCKGLCQEACGPIGMSVAEDERLQARGITIPPMLEALLDDHYGCPALTSDGRCSVYEVRPMICRLWAAVEDMPCPWGCRPEKPLTKEDSFALLNAVNKTGGGIAERLFREDSTSEALKHGG